MSSDVAIKVEGLGKCYQIYDKPIDRLKQSVRPRLQTLVGMQQRQYYREFWALRDVSFVVRKGETVGIIGRNGSGKSTLLQLICGVLHPTSGSITTHGRIAALLELGSGFNPEFTGRENVYMNASVLGLTTNEIDERLDDIVAFAGIGDFIEQPVKMYSSGMYVRLAFAIAVNVDASIMVVDEALSVGDVLFQNRCIQKMDDFRKAGGTILFVSHSPGQVESFCDRCIWLERGEMFKSGSPDGLIRDYINFVVHGIQPVARPGCLTQEPVLDGASVVSSEKEWDWNVIDDRNNVHHSPRAKIVAVRLKVNAEKNPGAFVSSPARIDVEALIEIKDVIMRPLPAVGLFNSLMEPIVHVNMYNLNIGSDKLGGDKVAILTAALDIPALRPGEYILSLGLDDGEPGASEVLSHVYGAWVFTVTEHPMRMNQAGYVQCDNATLSLVQMEILE